MVECCVIDELLRGFDADICAAVVGELCVPDSIAALFADEKGSGCVKGYTAGSLEVVEYHTAGVACSEGRGEGWVDCCAGLGEGYGEDCRDG